MAMIRTPHSKRTSAGFSLLEVLIAVVLLATGLLALAALQGSLARNSADAKTRSRIASLLAADMDLMRTTGYPSLDAADVTFTADDTTCLAPAAPNLNFKTAVCRARDEAALGSLTATRTTTRYGANAAGTAFVQGAAPAGSQTAEFMDILATATWSDATNQSHTMSMRGAVSELALDPNSPLVDDDSASNIPPRAIVRQALSNIVSAGMIPIAMGNGDSTAASNPTPELVGKNNNQQLVGTKYQVVTYTPQGSLAVVQQRVETEVLKCTCQYGAGGANLPEIYRTSQWPAVWTGKRYDVYTPDAGTAAPGQTYASGPKAGVTQSPLCQECCRDRHDNPADTANAKFDPENTNGYQKYDLDSSNQLVVATDTSTGTYVESCRIIRVDGFWRTAADMYARQFGLLETETVSNVEAKTGLPTTAAVGNYTTFVKDFLSQYDGSVGTAPTGAQAMYDQTARALNTPDVVDVPTPSNSDYRYLHARGLYVDHLEQLAREALVKSLTDRRAKGQCLAGSSGLADCVLPFLPFTTINLTEIADWTASDDTVLAVNTGNLLSLNPSQPSGSRAYAVKNGASDNVATIRKSNSGVAVSSVIPDETDLQGDAATATDAQPFLVANNSGGTKDEFGVTLTGGGTNPYVFYVFSGDTGECVKPKNSNHRCTTNSTLPLDGAVRVEHYWQEITVDVDTNTMLAGMSGLQQCTYNGTPVTIQTNGNDSTIEVPAFRNFAVTAANILGVPGVIGASSNEALNTESTTITFAAIPKNGTVSITLTEQTGSPIRAKLVACTASMDKQGRYYFDVPTWQKSWVP